MEGVVLNLVESWDEAQAFMSWLGERRSVLAFDTETTGLDWWKPYFVRLVQFGDLQTGWVIPWDRWGGLAVEALNRYNGPLVAHNLKFDAKALEMSGVELKKHLCQDTRTMAHLLDPANLTGLKELGVRYVDGSLDQGQETLKKGMRENRWTWETVPFNYTPYWLYSALDPVITAHLYQLFKPQIIGALHDVYEMEIQVLWILNEIEKKGARVDVEYCIEQKRIISEAAEEIHEWIKEEYGIGSGQNRLIADILLQEGVKLTKRTPSGTWSMDEDVLSGIEHPLARAVLNVRKCKKYAKAYFGNYIERAVDGIIHADINPLGARTGRMSVSKPPLQQIPRIKLLRDPFIPRPGNRLVSVDFDQVEFRMLAHMSQDPALIEAFKKDNDFFAELASQMYGRVITKKEPERGVTKNTMYGIAYGAGEEKSALMTGLTQAEMKAFRTKFDQTFPGLKAYMKSVEITAKQNALDGDGTPYVTTPMGRRQPADWFHEQWKYYALLNYQIQGAAADAFKNALVEMDRAGLTELMILPVHDEIVLDVALHEAEEVAQLTVECFEADDSWSVPLTAGMDILDRWGDKYTEAA